MSSGDQIILEKIKTLYECLAQQAEDGVEKINLLVSTVDVNKLSGDDRVALQGWHEGAQRSAKTIRQAS